MVAVGNKDEEGEDEYGLSPLQQGMLFHTLREKGVGMYISQAVSRYENLDCDAFSQAWQLVIDRHPILRTSFHWDDPENPVQVVHRRVPVLFNREDWCGLSPSEQNSRLRKFQREEREQGFDLNKPSQIRVTAIQVTRTRWFCVNSHHHIILDGWSGALLANEVGRAYEAYRRGRVPSFDPPIPFGNYIRWIEAQDLAAAKDFWQAHLAPAPLPTPLPAERELGANARVRMHVESWEIKLDDEPAARVERFAKHCRVTLNTVIQAVWPILLSRYSGRKSVIFGSLVSGRPPELPGVESIVGMFLNTVPFCVTVEDDMSVGEWLRQIHGQRTELQRYEHSPLMLVQQLSQIPGGLPLFNSIVARKDVTQTASAARREAKGSRTEKSEQATFQQNYPMLLNITASDGIVLKMTYDARKFRTIDISRIMEQLRHLLVALCADAERKLGEVGPASADELHRLRDEWNDTRLQVEHTPFLDELIAQGAQAQPDRVAVKHGEQWLTFRQLDRQVTRIAKYLQGCGLGGDDLIAVAQQSPVGQITAVLAVLRIGARCVPWDIRDHGVPPFGVCSALISDGKGDDSGEGATVIVDLDRIPETESSDDAAAVPLLVAGRRDAGEVALILRQSTGEAYEVSNWFLATRFVGQPVAFIPGTELALWSPGDSITFFSELYACWQALGIANFVASPGSGDFVGFCEALRASTISRVSVTPTILARILQNTEWVAGVAHIPTWTCSGEPLWPELGDAFVENLPQSRLVNIFTTTRLGACLAWEVLRGGCVAEGIRIGLPLPNVRAYLSSDSVHLAPVGFIGELLLAVDGAAPIGGPAQSVNHHHDNSVELPPSERIFPTGVLGRRWNDGSIEYLGLVDAGIDHDAIALTACIRVEREIAKTALVEEASVLPRGPGIRTAFIGTKYENCDLADLHKRLCRAVTKDFAPTHYLVLAELPLDRYGRTNRAGLQAMPEQGVDAAGFAGVIKKPKSELEKIIAEVWMEVLRIEKISTDDNFFELGGHSLAATKATARLTKILKSDIHLKGIFEAPTVSSFADWLQSDRHQEELPFTIEVADRGKDAPLTFTQQQLWVLGQLFPQLPTYTIPSNAIFTGEMDVDALRQALRDVVERHEILRTVFISNNGEPRQVVKPTLDDLQLEQVDLTHLPEDERMEKARWHGAQLGKKPWDFEHGPLIRPQLVKLAADHYLLNTAFHHIIADGPSMGVFIADLGILYEAHHRGRSPKLPDMPLQFADFAVWERENVKGELFRRQLDYWRETLDGAALLEIPTDFPRPAVHGFFGKKVKFEIGPETGSELRRLGREEGATMFMCLLAVYQLLLHKYSGQDDIVVGSAMTNRIRVELERLIGLFVNTVPLRTDFSGDPTFREILNRVRVCCLGAYANMDLPFEETIAQLQPHRDLSRQGSPLFQFMLIHNPGGRGRKEETKGNAPPLRPGDPHNDTGHANFDLLLSTRDTVEGLIKITMAYDTELFRQETIDRMIEHLQIILKAVTDSPDKPISRLDMSGDEERREILTLWNGREIEPETRLVHQLIADNGEQFSDYAAVHYRDRVLTYGELDRRSNQLAALLVDAGVRPESMVAICLPKSDDLIVGILAILKAGGAFVPVDPGYPVDRIRHILKDTDCQTLVSNPDLGPAIQQEKPDIRLIDITSPELDQWPGSPPDVQVSPANLVYVIFTSGSTGLPKGVMVEHRNLVNIIKSQIEVFEINRASRVLQMLSISFDAAVGEIFRTLVAGGTLYMADQDDLLPGPALVRLLQENCISVMAISPTALGSMPDCSGELPDLQTITVGGEACPQNVAERWGRGRRMLNAYGPTETTIGATLAVNWDFKGKPPLGRPLAGVKVYVLDKHGSMAPVGTPGELYIGGIGVTRGYLNRPELTESSFIPNPFSSHHSGDRVYRTGDLVRWLSTGRLDFLGRIDQQVKIRGFRIELGEIETALAKHPAIDHCTVSVYEANAIKRLIAYTVSKEGAVADASELRAFLKQKLPDYMIPAFFMPLARIPTTSSGKVDRRALPDPELTELVSGVKEYTAPANEVEQTIVQLWCEVLGLEQIGVCDNFFEIGGDSISAIRVAARANNLGVTFTAKDIFVNQTIRELADYLQDSR